MSVASDKTTLLRPLASYVLLHFFPCLFPSRLKQRCAERERIISARAWVQYQARWSQQPSGDPPPCVWSSHEEHFTSHSFLICSTQEKCIVNAFIRSSICLIIHEFWLFISRRYRWVRMSEIWASGPDRSASHFVKFFISYTFHSKIATCHPATD